MKIIKEIIPYIIIVVVIVLLRTFIITPVRVQGSSMKTTLENSDLLLLYKLGSIKRYDIVVIDDKIDDEIIIKRVIGMPGETIEIKNNKIYINDEEIEDEYAYGETSDYAKLTLKDDEYFLLGDNRLISKDSRIIGPVTKDSIEGKIVGRFFPLNKIGSID